tara:strand:- start:425 stop:769 length:345 start_codon:yes stop_codon:yes gene_type:complete
MKKTNWIPEIMYEESEEGNSNIPFVMVPQNEIMPQLLYIFESRDTGEKEPGLEGEPVPIFEWDLHQYADMLVLKNKLDKQTYDKVRNALGLEPLTTAVQKGQNITKNIRNKLNQ